MTEQSVRTIADAKARFREAGVTVTEWAAAHGFDRTAVYAVLSGRVRGHHGQGHRILVALGLKPTGVDVPCLAGAVAQPAREPSSFAMNQEIDPTP